MAKVGQLIYNVNDYNTSGGFISSKIQNNTISGTVVSTDPNYENLKPYIFELTSTQGYTRGIVDLIDNTGSKTLSKVGIQAPVGTKFSINEGADKIFMMGRTGVYEVDSDIKVNQLWFIRPIKWMYDDIQSEALKTEGRAGLQAAESARAAALSELDRTHPTKDDEYWLLYKDIQDTYHLAYDEAMAKFLRGVRGVYSTPSDYYGNNLLSYATYSQFPATGQSGKLYQDLSTGNCYVWENNQYVFFSKDIDYQEVYNIIVDYILDEE